MPTSYTVNTTIPSAANNSGNVNIGATLNRSNTFLEFSSRGGNSNPSDTMLQYQLVSSTGSSTTFDQIKFTRNTVNGGTLTICAVFVTDPNFTVQHFSGTFTGITLSVNLTSTVVLENTYLRSWFSTNGSSYTEDESCQITLTTTQITLSQTISSTGTFYCVQVISSIYFTVQQLNFNLSANGAATGSVTITSVDTTKSFIVGTIKTGSSQTARLGEKFVRFTFASSTSITVSRSIVTTSISGTLFVVSLPSNCEVTTTVATFSAATTPSSGGTLTSSRPFANCFPVIQGAANGYATNDITSDDAIDRANVCATLNSLTSGTTCSVTQQRSSASGTAITSVALVYFPQQSTTLSIIATTQNTSILTLKEELKLSVSDITLQSAYTTLREVLPLNLTSTENESINSTIRLVESLNLVNSEISNAVFSLRIFESLNCIVSETSDVNSNLRLIENLDLIASQINDIVTSLRFNSILELTNSENNNTNINLRLNQILSFLDFEYIYSFVDDDGLKITSKELSKVFVDLKLTETLNLEVKELNASKANIRLVEYLELEASTRVNTLADLQLMLMLDFVSSQLNQSVIDLISSIENPAIAKQLSQVVINLLIVYPSLIMERVNMIDVKPIAGLEDENL